MELSEIKKLMEMGFSLDDIKEAFFKEADKKTETESAPESDKDSGVQEQESKKNDSGVSSESLEALKNEISSLKTQLFKSNSSQNLGANPPESAEDILKNLFS